MPRSKIEDDIAYGLGGRAAEEIIFGEASTGASSDLEKSPRWRAPWSPGSG